MKTIRINQIVDSLRYGGHGALSEAADIIEALQADNAELALKLGDSAHHCKYALDTLQIILNVANCRVTGEGCGSSDPVDLIEHIRTLAIGVLSSSNGDK